MPMWGYSYGYGFGGVFWGVLLTLLCLALFGLLIWGMLSLIEGRSHRRLLQATPPSALRTLEERYARGEIDEPAFLRMREQITSHSMISASDPTS